MRVYDLRPGAGSFSFGCHFKYFLWFADVASEPDIIAGRNALLQEGNQPKNNDEPAVTDDLIGKLRG